jgi:hypothetical protein
MSDLSPAGAAMLRTIADPDVAGIPGALGPANIGELLANGLVTFGFAPPAMKWTPDDGTFEQIEIVTRGRHEEIDMGEWKPGELSEFKVKSALSYFNMTINGTVLIEIDPVNMVEIVGGVDLMAPHREAFGLG